MDWVWVMRIINNKKDLIDLILNNKTIRECLIRDIDFYDDDNLFIQTEIEDEIVLHNCVLYNCSFSSNSKGSIIFNVTDKISILKCTFSSDTVEIYNTPSSVFSTYSEGVTVYVRDSKFEGKLSILYSETKLFFINSVAEKITYKYEISDFYLVNSNVGIIDFLSEYLTIDLSEGEFVLVGSKVNIVDFAHLITIKYCDKFSPLLDLLLDSEVLVRCTKITFFRCDLSNRSVDNITVRSGIVFEQCNMTNSDFSSLHKKISHDTAMTFRHNCIGLDTINFGNEEKYFEKREDALAVRVTIFK